MNRFESTDADTHDAEEDRKNQTLQKTLTDLRRLHHEVSENLQRSQDMHAANVKHLERFAKEGVALERLFIVAFVVLFFMAVNAYTLNHPLINIAGNVFLVTCFCFFVFLWHKLHFFVEKEDGPKS